MSSELSPKAQELIGTLKDAVKEIEQINVGIESLQKRLNQFQKLSETVDELNKSLKVVDGIGQQLKLMTNVTETLKSVDQKMREAKVLLDNNRKSAENLDAQLKKLNEELSAFDKQYNEAEFNLAFNQTQEISQRIKQIDQYVTPQNKNEDKRQELILEEIKSLRNETREILRMLLYKNV